MKLAAIITAASVAFVQQAPSPPILPFTELSDEKIKVTLQRVVDAENTTPQDCNVILQLDHIRWKYNRMREVLYELAGKADDGAVTQTKHLGKIFDKIDAGLESDREQNLQEIQKKRKSNEQETNKKNQA